MHIFNDCARHCVLCDRYWEIIETSRRLALTAVLSVVSPGSSEQAAASILVAMLFLKLYNAYKPYVNDNDDQLAEIGQYQIYFTFFGALLLQNNMLNRSWDAVVGALLIAINFGVVLSAGLAEVRLVKQDDSGENLSQAEISFNKSLSSFKRSKEQTNGRTIDASATHPHGSRHRRSSAADREAMREYGSAMQKQKHKQTAGVTHPFSQGKVKDMDNAAAADGSTGAIELSSLSSRMRPARGGGGRRTLRDSDDSDDEDVVASRVAKKKAEEEAALVIADDSNHISRTATVIKRADTAPDSDDDSNYGDDDTSNAKNGLFCL